MNKEMKNKIEQLKREEEVSKTINNSMAVFAYMILIALIILMLSLLIITTGRENGVFDENLHVTVDRPMFDGIKQLFASKDEYPIEETGSTIYFKETDIMQDVMLTNPTPYDVTYEMILDGTSTFFSTTVRSGETVTLVNARYYGHYAHDGVLKATIHDPYLTTSGQRMTVIFK